MNRFAISLSEKFFIKESTEIPLSNGKKSYLNLFLFVSNEILDFEITKNFLLNIFISSRFDLSKNTLSIFFSFDILIKLFY